MKKSILELRLDYLWTCPLGERPGAARRNVKLHYAQEFWNKSPDDRVGIWGYKNAHRLEQRDPNCNEGIWGISQNRCLKMYGNLFTSEHADDDHFDINDTSQFVKAKPLRQLCYRRVTDATEAVNLIESNWPINFNCEITRDWYDPPNGDVPLSSKDSEFVASHAFCISDYNRETCRFIFPNSWGRSWGDCGWGTFPIENWDIDIIDAWDASSCGVFIPNESRGIICRGWKFGYHPESGAHCIEIYDADNDNHLAWAICEVRGSYLDVDEFFVRPESRNLGYARTLSELVKRLQGFVKRPLRLVVSFADTEDYSLGGARCVAKLFGLNLIESNVRWASMFGLNHVQNQPSRNWKPARPDSILERLRSSKEVPDEVPRQYTVFFGTDRKLIEEDMPEKGFLNERGRELRRGSCLIELPRTHKFGSVGRNWLDRFKPASQKSLRLVLNQPLDKDSFAFFAGELLRKFADDESQNLLFIHGYRCSFENAALRAAQLGYDLKIPGCTFFYSWPSAASAHGYCADEATIDTSVDYCLQFVMEILTSFPKTQLNIVAHSMGNRLTVNLFERLAQLETIPRNLGQLIFAAADIDADRFAESIKKIRHIPQRLTSYVSKGDGAIQLSELLHQYPRVGLAPPITVLPGVDTILVEGFRLFDLEGHGYFAEESTLLADMFNLIRYDSPPEKRPIMRSQSDPTTNLIYWSLPVG